MASGFEDERRHFGLIIDQKKRLPAIAGYHFLRYFICGVWVSIGAPFLFKILFPWQVHDNEGEMEKTAQEIKINHRE